MDFNGAAEGLFIGNGINARRAPWGLAGESLARRNLAKAGSAPIPLRSCGFDAEVISLVLKA